MRYRYRKTHEMKDSGVEQIGSVPKEWVVGKVRYISSIRNGQVNPLDEPYSNMPHIGPENVEKRSGRLLNYNLAKEDSLISGKYYFDSGDVLYGKINPQLGKVILSDFEGICSADMYAIVAKSARVFPAFLYYMMLSDGFFTQSILFPARAGIPKINRDELNSIVVTYPSLWTQTQIVDFLNARCLTFDTLIAKKEALVVKLEEAKKSLISEAVTGKVKIIDGKLVKRVPEEMKDSGLEWLGMIPKEWVLKRLKHITSKIGSGVTPRGGSEVYVEEGIPFLRSQNIHFDGLRLDDVAFITEDVHSEMIRSSILERDVLINITGASIGRVTFVPEKFGIANANQHVCIVRANDLCYYRYLSNVLASYVGQYQVFASQVGTSREGLTFEDLKNFIIPLPMFAEQESLSENIENKKDQINDLIKKIKNQIVQLQNSKQSLISEAVTGKIEILD